MASDAKFIDPLDQDDTFLYFDDFFNYTSTEMFTSLAADGGSSVADSDAHGGELVLTCGGSADEECAVATTQAIYLPVAQKAGKCKIRLKYTEADAAAANVALGFSNIFTANFITDVATPAEIAADFSGAVFYKKTTGTKWQVASSNGTTQTKTATNITAGGGAYHTFEAEILPSIATAGQADVIFRYDGQQVRDANGDTIKHYLTLASLLAMKVGVYAKQGGSTAQVVYVDYICWACKR
jgi:hypothetical protein